MTSKRYHINILYDVEYSCKLLITQEIYYVRKPFENIDLLDNITEIADMNSLEAKLSMADVNK